nr:hypothetical protein [Tanacetum cinerariifolium]GFB21542.1 hypothetical protein [Tanacetum cinerariifolium]
MASDGSDQDARYALSKLLQRGTVAEYENIILSWPSEEAPPVIKGSLDANEDTTLSLPRPDEEESTSGKMIADESVRIEQNDHVDFNEGKSLNLVVAANDVGNNGFSPMDHLCQGDLFATGSAVQVDTWNHNRPQPVNTFEWQSRSVRCNLREPNILEAYGNDMGITNYGLRLKDEAIKKLKERTQSQTSKKRLKVWDPIIKNFFLDATLRTMWM